MTLHFQGHNQSSFIDYPDKISTVLFVGGCNLHCSYCHNSSLLLTEEGLNMTEEEALAFLKKRKKYIDALCLSGGEVTLCNELPTFMRKAKEIGYLIKVDTNGTNPGLLRQMLDDRLVDYIAMDVKAPFEKYELVTRAKIDIESIQQSIEMIMKSGIDYEFRTTVCKELLSIDDLVSIAKMIKGAKRYCIQNFRDGNTVLAGKGILTPYESQTLLQVSRRIQEYVTECRVKNI